MVEHQSADALNQRADVNPADRTRLWKDGHGIERLPVAVTLSGGDVDHDIDAVVVRAADLLALEDVLCAAADIVACCSMQGIAWDDPTERAEFFASADHVWERMRGVWRGRDFQFEDDDAERPQ